MQKPINNPASPSANSVSSDTAFLNSLISSYPSFSFRPGKTFKFRPKKTIYYIPPETFNASPLKSPLETFPLLLCHELAHALLGHFSYRTDLERLKIEVSAWEETKSLCKKFKIPFSEELATLELDTYRNWLDKKSRCKTCGTTRFETPDGKYLCPRCDLL